MAEEEEIVGQLTDDSIEACIAFLYSVAKSHFAPEHYWDKFDLDIQYRPDYIEEQYHYTVMASVREQENFRPCLLYIGSGSGATVLEAMREACEDAQRMKNYAEEQKQQQNGP